MYYFIKDLGYFVFMDGRKVNWNWVWNWVFFMCVNRKEVIGRYIGWLIMEKYEKVCLMSDMV